MAAPSVVTSATGATDAGGAWSFSCNNTEAGQFWIAQILQDGNTNGAITSVVGTNIENLAGTDNVWTQVPGTNADGSWPCGSPAAARQFIYLGRALSSSIPTISGGNSTSEDLYFVATAWGNVSTGTTLATVIENGSAGNANNTVGTGTAVSDTGVTTLGPDRFAINLWAADDDGTGVGDFAGASGGDWGFINSFESASGTDGSVLMVGVAVASAGTIGGGTATSSVSVNWGNVGFALKGTTPDTIPGINPTRKNFVYLQRNNRGF